MYVYYNMYVCKYLYVNGFRSTFTHVIKYKLFQTLVSLKLMLFSMCVIMGTLFEHNIVLSKMNRDFVYQI